MTSAGLAALVSALLVVPLFWRWPRALRSRTRPRRAATRRFVRNRHCQLTSPDVRYLTGDSISEARQSAIEYEPPNPIEFIADGYSFIVRDPNLATPDLRPLSQTPRRYLLADQIDLARDSEVARYHGTTTSLALRLRKGSSWS
jgi:hypothetical protein